jgi:predicted secreted protein
VGITLEDNPSDGTRWQITKIEGAAVQQLGDPINMSDPIPDQVDPLTIVVGSDVPMLFKFKVVRSGQSKVCLEYVLLREKNPKPGKTFVVTIQTEIKTEPKTEPKTEAKVEQPTISLTEADYGKTITVKVGDVVGITLKNERTSFVDWQIANVEGEAVQQLGDRVYLSDPNPCGWDGARDSALFRFKVVKPGKSEVTLEFVRSWNKDEMPTKAFYVTVQTEGGGETKAKKRYVAEDKVGPTCPRTWHPTPIR